MRRWKLKYHYGKKYYFGKNFFFFISEVSWNFSLYWRKSSLFFYNNIFNLFIKFSYPHQKTFDGFRMCSLARKSKFFQNRVTLIFSKPQGLNLMNTVTNFKISKFASLSLSHQQFGTLNFVLFFLKFFKTRHVS